MTEKNQIEAASMDIAAQKMDELRRCLDETFPEVVAEGFIDFEQLQRVLGEWIDPAKERFGLSWPGKAECMKIIQMPSIATLKPVKDESMGFEDADNLLIEGDNLEVLKLLQKAYFGKVKMIYIDPPYNTGNEFIYTDKYAETLDTYLAYSGQIDDDGRKLSTSTEATGRYHSRWLNMLYPRLYLARCLLSKNGAIFISIDDGEVGNLRKLCDEVFGEENFVANVIWQKKYTRANDAKWFSDNHDHILVYARNKEEFSLNQLPRSEDQVQAYTNPDNHPRGPWKATPLHAKSGSNRTGYSFCNGIEWAPPTGTYRRFSDESMENMDRNNEIWFGLDGTQTPQRKSFLCDVKEGVTPITIWTHQEAGHNHEANNELKALDLGGIFDNPKPTKLIKLMLTLTTSGDDLVLDFFLGSGTTAQATLEKNAEDGGQRRFIGVQLPEPVHENSQAYKAGFNNISDICKERIRRVAKRIADEQSSQFNFAGASKPDLGVKVFRLDRSNFNHWDGDAGKSDTLEEQLDLHIDHIDQGSSPDDILYELLLKSGFPLTTKVEQQELANKRVFSIAEGSLLICLEKEVTPELMDALADAEPLQVICLDEAFHGNDQLKANAVQTFKSRAQAEESEIVFRTV